MYSLLVVGRLAVFVLAAEVALVAYSMEPAYFSKAVVMP
jgi:hypothetical protein